MGTGVRDREGGGGRESGRPEPRARGKERGAEEGALPAAPT